MEQRFRRRRAKRQINKIRRFDQKMQANLLLVFCIIITIFCVLFVRLVYIHKEDKEKYEKKVLSQQTYVSNVIAYKRGTIVDRKGTILAVSEKVYNLVLDPKQMLETKKQKDSKGKEQIVYPYRQVTTDVIIDCFGISKEEIDEILEKKPNYQYVVIRKELEEEETVKFNQVKAADVGEKATKEEQKAAKEKAAKIKGVWLEPQYKRKYPLKTVACDIVGFAKDNEASWGIEGYYNKELSGLNGREYGYFNGDVELERVVKPAINGNTIVSTIDATVQTIVEKSVAKFNEEVGANNVAVIVSNPNNGDIYAMTSEKSYDLNNPRDLSLAYSEEERKEIEKDTDKMVEAWSKMWRNYCVSDSYEPGSTFKPFTISAALDEHVITDEKTFYCDGEQRITGLKDPIKCTKTHEQISLRQAVMFSCNDALMQIGYKLGKKIFYRYETLFGFMDKTGIDLPGEGIGQFHSEERIGPVELATDSFGQGQKTTMIQMVAAFSSIINGGHYYQPHIVKKIENENGATVRNIEGNLVRQTVSSSTSELLKSYMYDTVEKSDGTAHPARVEGYQIGGKTGTAEKNYPRDHTNYIVSFLGFTPIDNPQVVIYVLVDQPKTKEGEKQSSVFATKLAKTIMENILPFLDIYPDKVAEADKKDNSDEKNQDENQENNSDEKNQDENQENNTKEEDEKNTTE